MANKLSAEVAAKYELVGITPAKRVFTNIGMVDFTSMKICLADKLYESGFKYLKLKATKPKKSGSSKN